MHTKKSRRSYTKVLRVIFSKGCKWAGGKVRACSMLSHFSCVQLFETPWTIARQASLSIEFSRQEYWRRLPFPSSGDQTRASCIACIDRQFFTSSASKEALIFCY